MSFILPIATLIALALFGMWWNGGGPKASSFSEALGNSDTAHPLLWGAFGITIMGIILGFAFKIMKFSDLMQTVRQRAKTMFVAFLLMVFA